MRLADKEQPGWDKADKRWLDFSHKAPYGGQLEIVRWLLMRGADREKDRDKANNDGSSSVHMTSGELLAHEFYQYWTHSSICGFDVF